MITTQERAQETTENLIDQRNGLQQRLQDLEATIESAERQAGEELATGNDAKAAEIQATLTGSLTEVRSTNSAIAVVNRRIAEAEAVEEDLAHQRDLLRFYEMGEKLLPTAIAQAEANRQLKEAQNSYRREREASAGKGLHGLWYRLNRSGRPKPIFFSDSGGNVTDPQVAKQHLEQITALA